MKAEQAFEMLNKANQPIIRAVDLINGYITRLEGMPDKSDVDMVMILRRIKAELTNPTE
jgi:hypothetical protein